MAGVVVEDIPSTALLARVVAELLTDIDRPDGPCWNLYRVVPSHNALLVIAAYMEDRGYPVALPADLEAGLRASVMLAEVHYARAAGSRVDSGLCAHQDNFTGVSVKCNSLIVYAANTANGGGLVHWAGDNDPTLSGRPGVLLSTAPPAGCMRAVLIPGTVWHAPECLNGFGVRESFVFQCRVGPT